MTTIPICPACGQPLPSDRVEEARQKALEEFNECKAKRLSNIEAEGKSIATKKDRITIELTELSPTEDAAPNYDGEIANKATNLNNAKRLAEEYTHVSGHADLLVVKTSIERDIEEAKRSVSVDRNGISDEIDELNVKLREAKAKADVFPRREQGEMRILELKDEEKKLAAEYEGLEAQLYLCEQFIKRKVSMLTDRINEKFEITRFKLFDVQVNGGLAECCEVTVDGIPYNGGLNNAAKINAGLDIIKTLQNHFNLYAPVIIDNAESVVDLFALDSQMIRLIVSEKDEVLRVEIPAKVRRAA